MVDPKTVNVATLPSVGMEERSLLPKVPCTYFCLSKDNEVLYIGKSLCPRQRWTASHHRFWQMKEIGDVRIAWLIVDSAALLEKTEE